MGNGHRPRQHCVTKRKSIDPDLILSDPVTSVACVESERVDTDAATQKVISLAADQGVRTGATNECVAAVSPPKQVGARSLVDTIIRTGRARLRTAKMDRHSWRLSTIHSAEVRQRSLGGATVWPATR